MAMDRIVEEIDSIMDPLLDDLYGFMCRQKADGWKPPLDPRCVRRADRERLLLEYPPVCYLCGKDLEEGWHVDHVWPQSLGGRNVFENYRAACAHCNMSKGATVSAEYIHRHLFGTWARWGDGPWVLGDPIPSLERYATLPRAMKMVYKSTVAQWLNKVLA